MSSEIKKIRLSLYAACCQSPVQLIFPDYNRRLYSGSLDFTEISQTQTSQVLIVFITSVLYVAKDTFYWAHVKQTSLSKLKKPDLNLLWLTIIDIPTRASWYKRRTKTTLIILTSILYYKIAMLLFLLGIVYNILIPPLTPHTHNKYRYKITTLYNKQQLSHVPCSIL